MGLFQRLKKGIKVKYAQEVESFKEKQVYKKQFEEELKKARRSAYLQQAIKSAEAKSRLEAKLRFGPRKKTTQQQTGSLFGPSVFSPLISTTPKKKKHLAVKTKLKTKLKRKKHFRVKKSFPKKKRPEFDDLFWKL